MQQTDYRYRFPRAEPGGWLGTPFAGAQYVVFALGCVVTIVAVLATLGSKVGFFGSLTILLASGIAAVTPIAGRSFIEWFPLIWSMRHRERSWRNRSHARGHRMSAADPSAPSLPPMPEPPPGVGSRLELHDVAMSDTVSFGVLIDRKAHSYTAAIQVRVGSWELLGDDQKAAKAAGWGRILTRLAREGTPISSLTWIEGTAVSDVHDLVRYYSEHRDPDLPLHSRTAQNLLQAMESAPSATQDHDIHLVIQIDRKRAGRDIATQGGKDGDDVGACRVLLKELRALAAALSEIEVQVDGALTARSLARVVREGYDPTSRQQHTRAAMMNPDDAGVPEHDMWPMEVHEEAGAYRTDNVWHRTLQIVEFPRDDVGVDFLRPLLLESTGRRRIAVVMRPIEPSKARKDVRSARTALRGNRAIKQKLMDDSADDVQRDSDLEGREWELQAGHGDYLYAGYVTVSAPTKDELNDQVYDLQQKAASAGNMILRTVWLEQPLAFTYTLPFGRGLNA
jgi:hypothetical protein